MPDVVSAALLGMIEGLTEFLPVSSTAHLILAGRVLGLQSAATFEVLIQLGAILAIISVYFHRLIAIAVALPRSPEARHFAAAIILAFLPAAVIGALAHDFIKSVLFESPVVVCIVLILGGVLLLVVDRIAPEPRYRDARLFSWPMAIAIGFFQCLAMIPGTSRSGATIVGALLLGADKRSAAEFSFFLAMPTMLGAFTLDLWKSRHDLTVDQSWMIVVGFMFALMTALLVVRRLLDFISKRGYALFGWWRIAVGLVGLIALQFVA